MIFQDIGTSVARLLRQNPGTNGLYTCADLSAVINDSNLDVCKDTNALQSSGEVYSVAGTYQYALSATCPNYLSIWKVYFGNKPIPRVPFGNFMWSTATPKSQGDPKRYRIWNNFLELDPTPADNQPIDIYFTYKPATLYLSGDTLELPSEFKEAIVYRACAYLTIKDEKEMRYNAFFQKYQYELNRIRALMRGNDAEVIDLDPANATTLNNWGSQY